MEVHHPLLFVLVFAFNFANGMFETDVTYEELEKLSATCNTLDNCKLKRFTDSLSQYTCHCGSFCSQLDTCCIDSPYRNESTIDYLPSCKSVHGSSSLYYFMIDSCPLHTDGDSIWYKLCEKQDDEDEDLMSLVPVTSLSSNLTYKNYFCYRCHEKGDAYRYWNIKVTTNLQTSKEEENNNIILIYSKDNDTWMAPIGEDGDYIPVTFTIETPYDIYDLAHICIPDVISNCSDKWQDDIVHHKCSLYTSIIYILDGAQTIAYKNPHCALCNFEDLGKVICALKTNIRVQIASSGKKPFSFTYLLDINRSDGDEVGKIKMCDDDSIWDPFFKKCRVMACALPGHKIQNGKCTAS